MDLYACKKKGMVKSVLPDVNMMQALQKTAKKKQKAASLLPPEYYEVRFTLLYDALRALLEILALQRGLKIYNHECYTAFLKESIKDSRLGDEFDVLRRVRNGINYYGEELSPEEITSVMEQVQRCLQQVQDKLHL